MDLFDVQILAKTLIMEFAPSGVRLEWSRTKSAFGDYQRTTKVIRLSKELMPLCTPKEVQDIVMHEIAHSLTPGAKHGPAWRIQMRKFGLNPDRTKKIEADTSILAKWHGVCPAGHGVVSKWKRRPTRTYACNKCCKGSYNAAYKLRIVAA